MTAERPSKAVLVLDSWAGRSLTPIEVIGQTAARWKIRAIEDMRLAGRQRTLKAGGVALVPRRAVVFTP